jgi:hypothetical protein
MTPDTASEIKARAIEKISQVINPVFQSVQLVGIVWFVRGVDNVVTAISRFDVSFTALSHNRDSATVANQGIAGNGEEGVESFEPLWVDVVFKVGRKDRKGANKVVRFTSPFGSKVGEEKLSNLTRRSVDSNFSGKIGNVDKVVYGSCCH